jgi:hypothetical protein
MNIVSLIQNHSHRFFSFILTCHGSLPTIEPSAHFQVFNSIKAKSPKPIKTVPYVVLLMGILLRLIDETNYLIRRAILFFGISR